MGKLVLQIEVDIDKVIEVKGSTGKVTMVLFHGKSDCENFKGEIMPGGCDTQKEIGGNALSLSARYALEGTDNTGTYCHIFIENNGTMEPGKDFKTKPTIITDSYALKWLETADLYGTIGQREGGVIISFYQNHEDDLKK